MSRIPVWIDTDTGVDDAVALLTAVDLEKKGLLEIRGISAVCGNAELDKTFENARNVMYLAGREDIPVFPPVSDLEDLELKEGEIARNIGVNVRFYDGWDE